MWPSSRFGLAMAGVTKIWCKNFHSNLRNFKALKICSQNQLVKIYQILDDSLYEKDQKNPGQNFRDHFRIEPNVCGLKLHTLS